MSLFVQCGFYWQKYLPFLYRFVFAGGGETPIWQKLFNLVFLFSPDTPVFIDAYVWVRLTALEFNAPWFSYSRFQHKKGDKIWGEIWVFWKFFTKTEIEKWGLPLRPRVHCPLRSAVAVFSFHFGPEKVKTQHISGQTAKKLSFRHSRGL